MQKVAAYLLERTEDLHWPDARKAEGERLHSALEAWLQQKGASAATGGGAYAAVDGSDASYRVLTVGDSDLSWTMFELTEVSEDGRRFVANLSVTVGQKSVVLFVTLEVGSVSTQINRIDVDARCPKVVRDLLGEPGTWHHGASRLRGLSRVDGFDAGETLALEIQNTKRTVPFVVVSRLGSETVLPDLDEKLAFDLAGLANVHTVDDAAAWALTDTLRKQFSCYSGAIRIYWPRLSPQDEPYRHHLWTAARLRGLEDDDRLALDRIRRQVRTVIMRASAASVVRPGEIDDIRNAAARAEYAALKEKASSLEDFMSLADSYAAHNDTLRHDLAARTAELEELRGDVMRLEAERQGLLFHLGQAKASSDNDTDVEPDLPEKDEPEQPPRPGDVRYYKKKYPAPTHDVLVRVGDCGHTSWQGAASADKAKKGIAETRRRQPAVEIPAPLRKLYRWRNLARPVVTWTSTTAGIPVQRSSWPRYPREIVLPLGTEEEFKEVATAITQEHRASSEWKRLHCLHVECIEPTERLFRMDTGRALGLDGWEGSTALRPPGGTARESQLTQCEHEEDRLSWSGPVVEADETTGSLFVAVDGARAPTRGTFYVRPFQFTALLKQLYTAPEHAALRFRLSILLHAAAHGGGDAPFAGAWSDPWNILWGPPGTGKTRLIGTRVAELLENLTERILVVSTTNDATDQAAILDRKRRSCTRPPR